MREFLRRVVGAAHPPTGTVGTVHHLSCRVGTAHRGSWKREKHPAAKYAFTIIELLLVLGIIAIVTAMAWPAFAEMFRSARLTDGASELRTFLRQARRQAIEDALVYRCDFLPDADQIRMVPSSDPWTEEGGPASPAPQETDEAFHPHRESIALPNGVRVLTQEEFDEGPPEDEESRDSTIRAEGSKSTDAETAAWVPLAELFPDGSASATTIRLVNEQNAVIELVVDPLTGQVTIGDEQEWLTKDERLEREQEAMSTEGEQ